MLTRLHLPELHDRFDQGRHQSPVGLPKPLERDPEINDVIIEDESVLQPRGGGSIKWVITVGPDAYPNRVVALGSHDDVCLFGRFRTFDCLREYVRSHDRAVIGCNELGAVVGA